MTVGVALGSGVIVTVGVVLGVGGGYVAVGLEVNVGLGSCVEVISFSVCAKGKSMEAGGLQETNSNTHPHSRIDKNWM